MAEDKIARKKTEEEMNLFVPEYANKDDLVTQGEVFTLLEVNPTVTNAEGKEQIEYTIQLQDGYILKMRHGRTEARLEEAHRLMAYLEKNKKLGGVQLAKNEFNNKTYYRFRFA